MKSLSDAGTFRRKPKMPVQSVSGEYIMKIVCFGDSNTYGFDPRLGSTGRYDKNERWTGILDGLDGFSVLNEGMNGRCIPNTDAGFASLEHALDRNPDADVFMILLGTNDLFMVRGITAQGISDRMRRAFQNVPALREFTRKKGKHTLIVSPARPSDQVLFYAMAGIPTGQTKESAACILRELPGELEKCAREFGALFADAGEWDIPLSYDGIHFSEEGHRCFAKHMADVLRGLS